MGLTPVGLDRGFGPYFPVIHLVTDKSAKLLIGKRYNLRLRMGTESHTAPAASTAKRRRRTRIGSTRRPWDLLVAAAALGDLSTTYVILTTPRSEGNVVLNALADRSVAVAILAFAAFCLLLVVVALSGHRWLSDVARSYVLLAMGFSTVNNAVAFASGVILLGRLCVDPAAIIAYGFPLAGLGIGVWRAHRRGPLPWREVAGVSTVLVGLVLLCPALIG
jgi:hypothetical protein